MRKCSSASAVPHVATAVGHAGQRERHHVGVALADHHLAPGDDLALRPVQPVQQPRLLVDRCLGRVLVLRSVAVERATAEADRFAARVPDREHQPAAELVLQLLRAVHEREPGVDDVLARELLVLQVLAQRVVTVGRVAEREPPHDVAVVAAAAEVAARVPGLGRAEQQVTVEGDRFADRVVQPLLALALLRERRVVVTERDPGARRESFDGFGEVEVLDLADERDRVAALLAAEAVEDAHFRIDRERRRLLAVERAQADEAAADALEPDVLARERDEVGDFADPSHVLVEDAHRCRVRRGLDPAGRSSGRQPSSSTPSASA